MSSSVAVWKCFLLITEYSFRLWADTTYNIALENFVVGIFAVRNFAVRIYNRTEFSLYAKNSQYGIFAVSKFRRMCILPSIVLLLILIPTDANIKYWYKYRLYTHCFIQIFHRILNLKTWSISAYFVLQSRNALSTDTGQWTSNFSEVLIKGYPSAFLHTYACIFLYLHINRHGTHFDWLMLR